MKLTWGVGGLSAAFIIGAVFWAGASYQRLLGMEKALVDIQSTIANFVTSQANSQIQVQQNTRDIEFIKRQIDRMDEAQRGQYRR